MNNSGALAQIEAIDSNQELSHFSAVLAKSEHRSAGVLIHGTSSIGAQVLAENVQNEEVINSDRLGLYDDTTTWLAETLDGSMRTQFEYSFDGHELYGRDGSALKTIFKDSIADTQKLAANQPNLAFELRRRWIEMGEYRDMIAMAKNELPNTMVTISDFPPELMEANQDIGGYNVSRKQTMLRVITKRYDGTLVMRSQSLDGSNRPALEAIYKWLSYEPQPGELLGQRLHFDLPGEDQQLITDKLMGVYDRSLTQHYGGEWYAGRTPAEMLNTYHFVKTHDDLVKAFIEAKMDDPDGTEGLRYGLAAAMEKRFNKNQLTINPIMAVQRIINYPEPLQEMAQAGRQAVAEGKTYSGCGISATADNQGLSANEQLSEAGFGNKTTQETKYKFNKEMHCVVCQSPPKKDEPKKLCGPCGICRLCDTKLKKA